jgi:hypothetical protein
VELCQQPRGWIRPRRQASKLGLMVLILARNVFMADIHLLVVAISLTGDMRHTANQPYNVGTGANKNGVSAF